MSCFLSHKFILLLCLLIPVWVSTFNVVCKSLHLVSNMKSKLYFGKPMGRGQKSLLQLNGEGCQSHHCEDSSLSHLLLAGVGGGRGRSEGVRGWGTGD